MSRRWQLVVAWALLLAVSVLARTYVGVADEARMGRNIRLDQVLAVEITSHIVVAALLPFLYWLHRRWPMTASIRNFAIHVAALVPFSLIHTSGMAALRLLWFAAILGEPYSFPLTADRLAYEFAKDVLSYVMLNAGIVALTYIFDRLPRKEVAAAATAPPERFAVRKRGGSEVMVEVADIDWVEASGNYAILHVGGETFEIRSSLTRLEAELDPRKFVRVHKSHIVNIARVTEVTPWVSGDWRIRLQDGAEVNLSRRYRQRFEALAPVRS
jgi:DNA-binding LytR/AlgR family response regulator